MFFVSTLLLLISAVAFQFYLNSKEVDRRYAVDASLFTIDNEFYNSVDWWSEHGTMRALRAMTPTRADYFHQTIQAAGGGASKAHTILDVGCGAGFVSVAMAQRGYTIVGVDPSRESTDQAKQQCAKLALDNAQFVSGSAEKLPFDDASVDAVIMADVLEHIGDLPTAIAEAARVLKKGGLFLFDTINRTRWSYLLTIVALQHLGIGGICPPHTHDWSLYIRPEELEFLLKRNELELGELRGLSIRLSPTVVWTALSGGNFEPQQFEVNDDQSANYIGYATKK